MGKQSKYDYGNYYYDPDYSAYNQTNPLPNRNEDDDDNGVSTAAWLPGTLGLIGMSGIGGLLGWLLARNPKVSTPTDLRMAQSKYQHVRKTMEHLPNAKTLKEMFLNQLNVPESDTRHLLHENNRPKVLDFLKDHLLDEKGNVLDLTPEEISHIQHIQKQLQVPINAFKNMAYSTYMHEDSTQEKMLRHRASQYKRGIEHFENADAKHAKIADEIKWREFRKLTDPQNPNSSMENHFKEFITNYGNEAMALRDAFMLPSANGVQDIPDDWLKLPPESKKGASPAENNQAFKSWQSAPATLAQFQNLTNPANFNALQKAIVAGKLPGFYDTGASSASHPQQQFNLLLRKAISQSIKDKFPTLNSMHPVWNERSMGENFAPWTEYMSPQNSIQETAFLNKLHQNINRASEIVALGNKHTPMDAATYDALLAEREDAFHQGFLALHRGKNPKTFNEDLYSKQTKNKRDEMLEPLNKMPYDEAVSKANRELMQNELAQTADIEKLTPLLRGKTRGMVGADGKNMGPYPHNLGHFTQMYIDALRNPENDEVYRGGKGGSVNLDDWDSSKQPLANSLHRVKGAPLYTFKLKDNRPIGDTTSPYRPTFVSKKQTAYGPGKLYQWGYEPFLPKDELRKQGLSGDRYTDFDLESRMDYLFNQYGYNPFDATGDRSMGHALKNVVHQGMDSYFNDFEKVTGRQALRPEIKNALMHSFKTDHAEKQSANEEGLFRKEGDERHWHIDDIRIPRGKLKNAALARVTKDIGDTSPTNPDWKGTFNEFKDESFSDHPNKWYQVAKHRRHVPGMPADGIFTVAGKKSYDDAAAIIGYPNGPLYHPSRKWFENHYFTDKRIRSKFNTEVNTLQKGANRAAEELHRYFPQTIDWSAPFNEGRAEDIPINMQNIWDASRIQHLSDTLKYINTPYVGDPK